MRRLNIQSIATLTLAIFLICFSVTNVNAQTSIIVGASEKEVAMMKQIEKALDQPCQLSLDETPLSKLPGILSKQMGIVVKIDKSAFEKITPDLDDTLLTHQIKNISYRSALKLILNDLDADFTIKNEVLLITTKDKMIDPRFLQTRIYGVKDFVETLEEVFDSKKPELVVEFAPLIEMIQITVDPNSWQDTGDGDATILGYDATKLKVLVISQTPENHRKIEDLLSKLRKYRIFQTKMKDTAKPKK